MIRGAWAYAAIAMQCGPRPGVYVGGVHVQRLPNSKQADPEIDTSGIGHGGLRIRGCNMGTGQENTGQGDGAAREPPDRQLWSSTPFAMPRPKSLKRVTIIPPNCTGEVRFVGSWFRVHVVQYPSKSCKITVSALPLANNDSLSC